jgi:hypothetical protein
MPSRPGRRQRWRQFLARRLRGLALEGDGWYFGDFNGDGRDDVFRYNPGVLLLSDGSGFVSAGSWTSVGLAAGGRPLVRGDFNGDGRDDIFRYNPGVSGAGMFLSTGRPS